MMNFSAPKKKQSLKAGEVTKKIGGIGKPIFRIGKTLDLDLTQQKIKGKARCAILPPLLRFDSIRCDLKLQISGYCIRAGMQREDVTMVEQRQYLSNAMIAFHSSIHPIPAYIYIYSFI